MRLEEVLVAHGPFGPLEQCHRIRSLQAGVAFLCASVAPRPCVSRLALQEEWSWLVEAQAQAVPGLEEACLVVRRLGPRALGSWIADVCPSCALPCHVPAKDGPMPGQLSRLASGPQPAYVAFLRRAQPALLRRLRQAEEAVVHHCWKSSRRLRVQLAQCAKLDVKGYC